MHLNFNCLFPSVKPLLNSWFLTILMHIFSESFIIYSANCVYTATNESSESTITNNHQLQSFFVCLFVCLFFPISCSTGLVCQLLPDFLFLTYDKVIRIQWKNFIFELQYFLYFSSNICLAECLCVQCTLYICESSTEFWTLTGNWFSQFSK